MHPHDADRHAVEVAETRGEPRIEGAAEPEIGPEPQREVEIRAAVRHERRRGLNVWDDADRRPLRIDAPAEREAHRDEHHGSPAHERAAQPEDERAVEREVGRVRDHPLACLGTHEQLRAAGPAGIEHPAAQTDIEVGGGRSEEHTSELQSRSDLVCRLLLEKKKNKYVTTICITSTIY